MTTRRYDDDEVAEILALATRDASSSAAGRSAPSEGLTLEELQAIALDVGIAPTRIAEAARALERRATTPAPRTLLGAPRSVARIVPLERALDDAEWERLVAELRSTFGAVGKVTAHGTLRSWSNGNLQAHVEPEGDGWRLRMQTFKEDAAPLAGMGSMFTLMGSLILVLSLVEGADPRRLVVALAFMLGGLGHLGYLRWSLTGWADERASQMELVANRVAGLLKPGAP
jgi:hypothetical protein